MRRQQGFTLLEIILVMALMALVVSGVMLTVSSAGPEKEVQRQAFRFKVAMTLALDRALLTGEELGLVVTGDGYQFVRWKEFQWQPIDDDKALAPFELDEDLDMVLELSLEGLPWQQETFFESDDGLFEELFKEEEDEKKIMPQVFIYSHGEFTDFNLMFHWRGDEPFTINAAGLTYKVELLDEDEFDRVEPEAKQQGMTLIEVLVALMVFSYAAITLVTASSSNISSQSRLRDKTLANWVAQNQLTEFLLEYNPESDKKKRVTNKTEMAGQTFYYRLKVEENGSDWLNSVKVEVSSDEEMEYLITTLNGFVEKP